MSEHQKIRYLGRSGPSLILNGVCFVDFSVVGPICIINEIHISPKSVASHHAWLVESIKTLRHCLSFILILLYNELCPF